MEDHIEFLERLIELGNVARADLNHGNGIDTKEDKEDFVQFYESQINKVETHFNSIKNGKYFNKK